MLPSKLDSVRAAHTQRDRHVFVYVACESFAEIYTPPSPKPLQTIKSLNPKPYINPQPSTLKKNLSPPKPQSLLELLFKHMPREQRVEGANLTLLLGGFVGSWVHGFRV